MKSAGGFTLIEVMIVVAITGILASTAFAAYQDYMVRSRVVEGISLTTNVKKLVSENAMVGASFTNGFVSPTATVNVSNIAVSAVNGYITITFTAKAGNGTIILRPQDNGSNLISGTPPASSISWDCTTGTLINQFRPLSCR